MRWYKRIRFVWVLTILAYPIGTTAQETVWRDTLQAAVKMDSRRVEVSLGRVETGLEGVRGVISPMGEGDPVRWAQSLPGVTTGADGTTAMYVRGGGVGNTLFSLDGVPVYGYAHILGLTTIVPTLAIERAELGKGGFDGSESNFTSSHLRIVTKAPSSRQKTSFALNNFLASAGAEGPLGNSLSYSVFARVSPLALEYQAVRGILPDLFGGSETLRASVGDLYAKLRWQCGGQSSFEASILGSVDRYGFDLQDSSHEVMGWQNLVGIARFCREGARTRIEVTASANRYRSIQKQSKIYRETENHLSLRSDLREFGVKANLSHFVCDRKIIVGEGLNVRYAQFAPGQVDGQPRYSNTMLASFWLQAESHYPERLFVKATVRGNYYRNMDFVPTNYPYRRSGERLDPELSLSAKWALTRNISLEFTHDKLMQYYHTLEGLPVGWSLDMIVPTGEHAKPEMAHQSSAGISGSFGAHRFSIGGFHKRLKNLIYYKYSQALFSGALATWEKQIEIGNGRAYGLETYYEYKQENWDARVSYTLSKSTRDGFHSFYDGQAFHARFDRRHVLNATVRWRGFMATFILQSGHWENGQAETYELPFLEDFWSADYYSGVNNYQMPTVIRLDLGWQKSFCTGRMEHTVSLGVCNVTNHFNPFMLYFDPRTESWKEIALLPLLPNFSWRLVF